MKPIAPIAPNLTPRLKEARLELSTLVCSSTHNTMCVVPAPHKAGLDNTNQSASAFHENEIRRYHVTQSLFFCVVIPRPLFFFMSFFI